MELDEDALRELEQVLTIALIRLSTRDAVVAQQQDGSYPCRNGYNVLALDDFERRGLLRYEPDSNTLELSPTGADFGDRALDMLITGLETSFGYRPAPPSPEPEPEPDPRIFHLRIDLDLGDLPACWREISIRADATFLDLHLAIQRIFAWNDEHLFAFEVPLPDGECMQIDELAVRDLSLYEDLLDPVSGHVVQSGIAEGAVEQAAHNVRLNEVFPDGQRTATVTYIYNLEARWQHTIALAGIEAPPQSVTVAQSNAQDASTDVPCLLAGSGDAPPDGTGSLDGYRYLLTVLDGPRNTERAEIMRRLLSQNYRPFNLEAKARELAGFFIQDRERWNEQIEDAGAMA